MIKDNESGTDGDYGIKLDIYCPSLKMKEIRKIVNP